MSGRKAIVAYHPEEVGPLVTMQEAVDFAWRRWRMECVIDRRAVPPTEDGGA